MHFFIFKFKALFWSILMATENKLILRKFVKICPILLISSNFFHPYDYFLQVPNSSLGPPKYEINVRKRNTFFGFVKMHGCHGNL